MANNESSSSAPSLGPLLPFPGRVERSCWPWPGYGKSSESAGTHFGLTHCMSLREKTGKALKQAGQEGLAGFVLASEHASGKSQPEQTWQMVDFARLTQVFPCKTCNLHLVSGMLLTSRIGCQPSQNTAGQNTGLSIDVQSSARQHTSQLVNPLETLVAQPQTNRPRAIARHPPQFEGGGGSGSGSMEVGKMS